ncbi:hypothetical protein DUNSADRAFT_13593 [Dunaliella salina]|uniref:F-box domain-containing protein n=1 Tax=Dunaliella salina TaxID=3046 RepID=A0ABQ7H372_DUNSA|nr:hypothetical protein DUNSADRAFT_13593 [Dunaliella salina]|eukprot:KAF5841319.1 hypothetical protein DUNSADRAFT_13593 [Dunaliella salina]
MVYLFPNTPAYLLVSTLFPALQVGLCGALVLTAVPPAGKQLQKSVRRSLHQWRRRRTAKALHALRYDREYLLGQLPPIVSAQILSYLDRASLASLRCEQVLSLSLHATQDSTSAWLRPQDNSHHASTGSTPAGFRGAGSDVGVGLGSGGVGSGGGLGGGLGVFGYASEPPSADCCVADAALKGFLVSRGLQDLPCMRVLDMSHCSASFELDTWQLLARALPDGSSLVVPVSALQGARRTGYASRAAQVHQVLPALKALATRSPTPSKDEEGQAEAHEQSAWDDDRKLQARRHKGLQLELVGVNLQVSSYPALEELCRVGAHMLVRLALSETYPHAGHLPWGPLTLLSKLRELSVTPATPASLTALLGVLPTMPNLTHLALGDVGSAHSIARSVQSPVPGVTTTNTVGACTVVQAKELEQLQACPKLSHLELHTLRLPPTVEVEAPSSSNSRAATDSAIFAATYSSADTTSTTDIPSSTPTRMPPAASPSTPGAAAAATAADAAGSSTSLEGEGQLSSMQGSNHGMHAPPSAASAPSLARTTLPPLTNLQSLSALHVEVARPRHTGPVQEAPPSAQPFLHLFPGLTHLSLGVCPRSSHRISMGLTHAAAAAANSTATGLAAASSDDLDPSEAAVALAAAGLPVPRPLPLLPLLAGLPHLCSLGLAGVWASQCVREASAASAPGAPTSSVTLEVALAGLRHAQVYHCVAYDQLCRLLHPLLQLPYLHSLGLHFCGTAPKGAGTARAQQSAGQQGNAASHALHLSIQHPASVQERKEEYAASENACRVKQGQEGT